jgi:amino acid transporter
LFLAAAVSYAVSLFLEMLNGAGLATLELYISITKVVFTVLFLGGILTMRDLIRDMDGEKDRPQT